ncbi:MAG: response regulator [Calditrichia bacterium]|nr:response regulator [Calditrichia bacterium]
MQHWNALVVDDQDEITSHLQEQLNLLGLKVSTAENYKEAQFLIDHQAFELAIIDISLPDGNGIDLYRTLRKKNPDIYTIIITGNSTIENAVTALNEGVNAYLQKPFSDKQLHGAISHAEKTLNLKSENKALFQAIELNRQFYEDLLNSTSEAILVIDLDYQIRYGNRASKSLLSVEETSTGTQFLHDYLEDGYKVLSHVHQQLIQGKTVAGYRVSVKNDAHMPFDAHLSADFLYDKKGEVEGLIINLSNPLIYDEALNRILRKEKLATIIHLANTLSHEIRNPINILSGRLQLLESEIENPENLKSFESIERQIDRILHITDLLNKFNLSREDSIPEKINLIEIFRQVYQEKEDQFSTRKIKAAFSLQGTEFWIEGNQVQFIDAFHHLLDSVIELTPPSQQLEISGKEISTYAHSKWYEFQLIIPGIQLNTTQLFEPYQSIDMEMNGFLGLGMAIMHTIFQNYGAKIESFIQNQEQTLIRIRFPFMKDENPKKTKSRSRKKVKK